jgi:hypothetical protein
MSGNHNTWGRYLYTNPFQMVLALWSEDNDRYHSATHAPLVISRLTGNLKYIEPVLLCQLLFLYFDLYVFISIYILPISPYFSVAKSSHCVVLVKLVLQSLIQGWEPDLSQLTSPDDHHYYHPHKHPSIPSVTCANGECW